MQKATMPGVWLGLWLSLWLGLIITPATVQAQQENQITEQPEDSVLREGMTRQLSPHVFIIYGNPNIAIVVGSKATLVVETGMGRRNGAFVAEQAAKLTKGARLYLTTTHPHPEHSAGQDGFPPDTIVIRPKSSGKWTRWARA
jgi:glyoxylase-like metal-dependent hydrolase (beta-lactamase superfamily II)